MRGLSKRIEFVKFNPKVWVFLRLLEKYGGKDSILRLFSKVTGRLLLEVAVKKTQVEQNRNSAQMPEAWSETLSHIHFPEQSHP
jgi:hypothetical protein